VNTSARVCDSVYVRVGRISFSVLAALAITNLCTARERHSPAAKSQAAQNVMHQPEHCSVFSARHHLWRRRKKLLQTEIPSHSDGALAASSGGQSSPGSNAWGSGAPGRPATYAPSGANNVQMHPLGTSIAGGNSPHNNVPPLSRPHIHHFAAGNIPSASLSALSVWTNLPSLPR